MAVLLSGEAIYLFADIAVFWLLIPQSMAHVAIKLWERATDLIAPQIITGYPLFGFVNCVVLIFSDRRERRTAEGH